MNDQYYDELETRDPQVREQALFDALQVQVANAQKNTTAYASILQGIDSAHINNREALGKLPVTRKSELIELQRRDPPFGGFVPGSDSGLRRIFASPGPIYEPQGKADDYCRMARALYAAGFRSGQLVHNTFSYHFTPAGSIFEMGAHALGCAVFPAGVGQTEQQTQVIADLRPQGYAGTPSFLKIILDKAKELGRDVSSLSRALVGGEALPPSLRSEIKNEGIDVYQCYATAEIGLIAYESWAMEGLIIDEGIILEIVRPGTADPASAGEVGEVVVTTLNPDYPLIRFATGDLSVIMPGVSPCGRTNSRLKGWLGRADQTTKVKGMFVHPSQVAEILRRHPEVAKGRLVVDRDAKNDVMTLHCEVGDGGSEALAQAIANTVREVCKLNGRIAFAEPGSLANDGKVIDDIRTYE